MRRLEDKLDAKFLDNVTVNIRMGEPHNNKKHALLYPALVCWPAGTSESIFNVSKLIVDRLADVGTRDGLQVCDSNHLSSLTTIIISLSHSLSLSFSASLCLPLYRYYI